LTYFSSVIELRTDCTLLELASILISLPDALSVKDALDCVAAWNLIWLLLSRPARIMSPLTGLPVGFELEEENPDDGLLEDPDENPDDGLLEDPEDPDENPEPDERLLLDPDEKPLPLERLLLDPDEKPLERLPPDEEDDDPPPFPEMSETTAPNKKAPATNKAKNRFIAISLKNRLELDVI